MGPNSRYVNSNHIAIVKSIDKDKITLLESVNNNKTEKGVCVLQYTPEEFKKYLGKNGIHVLRNDTLKKFLNETTQTFSDNYFNQTAKPHMVLNIWPAQL
ncbi:hypothetical protein [Parachlamydia acanthamoebae]|uniref:hypothetical protein n=1 Tax=Parachlamydia acanthamoebae TaxID=83552 RepID=UPI000750C6A0|nr:hypothetical protein [Parachlamydia acanthamoebae]